MRWLAILVVMICGVLRADTVRVFSLDNFHQPHSTLRGTISIDVTTGQAISADFLYTYFGDFGEYGPLGVPVSFSGPVQTLGCVDCLVHPDEHRLGAGGSVGADSIFLWIGTPGSLVDYHGAICFNNAVSCAGDNYVYVGAGISLPAITYMGHDIPAEFINVNDYYFFDARLDQVAEFQTPEPTAFVLFGTGILGLAGAARRRLMT